MSRSGYSDDCDNLGLWRQTVRRAIEGKRGQKLLRELEAALIALPNKRLVDYAVAIPEQGEVCALGAVALKRRLDKGMDRTAALEEIAEQFPEGCEASELCDEFDIAEAMAREITYINDERERHETPEQRYDSVLGWVRSKIVKDKS